MVVPNGDGRRRYFFQPFLAFRRVRAELRAQSAIPAWVSLRNVGDFGAVSRSGVTVKSRAPQRRKRPTLEPEVPALLTARATPAAHTSTSSSHSGCAASAASPAPDAPSAAAGPRDPTGAPARAHSTAA